MFAIMQMPWIITLLLAWPYGQVVCAGVPSGDSWQQYIVAPTSREISPVSILSQRGNVSNAAALLSKEGVTRLSRALPSTYPSWPNGTTAVVSSVAAPNTDEGQYRTYDANNSIDNDLSTFWNDNTVGAYPDVLTITSPIKVELLGVTLQSNNDGVPVDFTVEAWNDSDWILSGSIIGNSAVRCRVPFNRTVTTNQVRVTVTRDQAVAKGEYTRVNELWPGLVKDDPPTPEVVLDFGQNIVGFLQISFVGASADSPGIRLAFSETQEYLTNRSDFTRSDNGDAITPGTDQFVVPVDPVVWTDTHGCLHGSQVCADGLHGFRYLKISLDALASDLPYAKPYGIVDIGSVSLNFTAYLGAPSSYTGWFECSDERLNQFWYNAAYTNEMNTDTFQTETVDPRDASSPSLLGKTVIFDGAKRDRDPYVGDIAISGRTAYLTHRDTSNAARNVIADLADHQRADGWIPPASINNYTLPLFDYPLWWVITSWDYVLYTGDLNYAESYYPNLVKVLDTWYPSVTNTTTDLLSKGINDTSGYGDYAFLPRDGEITYFNALYVLALKNAVQLSTILQHTDDAARWQEKAETVSEAINQYLWDENVGAYLDSSRGSVRHGQDGNAIAIVAGVANSTRAQSALAYLGNHTRLPYGNAFMDNESLVSGGSTRVYAFISYFDIEARFLTENADSALEQIRRLYGWMTDHDPKLTFWEGIGTNGSAYEDAYTSMAHGWSTGVLPALTNHVLGIQPTAPGFQRFVIQPSFSPDVTWARGQQETKYGLLYVDWSVDDGTVTVNIDVPNGTVGDIFIPQRSDQSISLDGNVVWNGSKMTTTNKNVDVQVDDGYISILGVASGSHIIISAL